MLARVASSLEASEVEMVLLASSTRRSLHRSVEPAACPFRRMRSRPASAAPTHPRRGGRRSPLAGRALPGNSPRFPRSASPRSGMSSSRKGSPSGSATLRAARGSPPQPCRRERMPGGRPTKVAAPRGSEVQTMVVQRPELFEVPMRLLEVVAENLLELDRPVAVRFTQSAQPTKRSCRVARVRLSIPWYAASRTRTWANR